MKAGSVLAVSVFLALAGSGERDPAALSPYYERLQETCDTGCCDASVRTMAEHGWKSVEDVQDCQKTDTLRCIGAVPWCEDRSFPEADLQ
ncbi:MAG: hypothetical protein M3O22_03410 [Pseudomonadota bacterium]|nr:hypothetical protein [Pseudomonadota bacterium]